MPVLTNLFGTTERIALGMGRTSADELRDIGELLACLKEPEPPGGLKDIWSRFPMLRQVMHMRPRVVKNPAWQEIVLRGDEVDLNRLPIQTCWPHDAAPLLTWGLVVTKGRTKSGRTSASTASSCSAGTG